MSLLKVFLALLFIVFSWYSSTRAVAVTDTQLLSEHQRAVDIARSGNHQLGLDILQQLHQQAPDYYPVYRDLVIITSWTGDCDTTLSLYSRISARSDQEAYLIAAVSECLYLTGHRQQAMDKLDAALTDYPGNTDLVNMQSHLLQKQAEQQKEQASRVNALFELTSGYNESDQGNREWLLQSRYTRYYKNETHLFARFNTVRADDPQFDTGDLNRLAVGVHKGFLQYWYLETEFSVDINRRGEGGTTMTLAYEPDTRWHFDVTHATHTEDLPLRAKALGIESNRTTFSADFHTSDYRWLWSAAHSHYLFSDDNNRESTYTALEYAYVLKPEREHRLILELYASSNTELNTVYYNPLEDKSVSLIHQLDIVYDSRFTRHVDHLYVHVGNYIQQGEDVMGTGGIRYVQEYDFDSRNSMQIELAWRSSVYDGGRESESSVLISYSRKI